MRHRGSPQRGQVHAVQCADARADRGGELSVLHHRPERRHRAGARPAARRAVEDRGAGEDRADHGRVRRHRGPGGRRVAGRRTRQQVPRAHPRDRCDLARGALFRRRRHRARVGARESDLGHRHHRHRARAHRSAVRGKGRGSQYQGRQGWRQGRGAQEGPVRAHAKASRRRQARALHGTHQGRKGRQPGVAPAHGQARDVRGQREGRRIHQQRASRCGDQRARSPKVQSSSQSARPSKRRSASSKRPIAPNSCAISGLPSPASTG